jgi:ABC-type nitrate/sulfonate/bicarbonate transport system substrate-binding protein
LLPGSCGVHYSSEPERRLRLSAALEAGSIDAAIAIDDYAAVLYEGGVMSKVVTWREGANAYSLTLLAGKAIVTPHEFISIGAGGA